jgi:serine/threonine protein kinase
MSRDPETKEFIMVLQFANKGSLRNILSNNFHNITWKDKIKCLQDLIYTIRKAHKLGYFHNNLHSGNLLQLFGMTNIYIADFGLSGSANENKLNNKICGVLPYIAPEVLNGEPYTSSSDIYSFGVIMAELSSGKPPFYYRKHDNNLALDICNGLRPEFESGTPHIYKKLAHRCMRASPFERPTAEELYRYLSFWNDIFDEKVLDKGEKIKAVFNKADKEIQNISIIYEKHPNATYVSREFTFRNLPTPVNSLYNTLLYLGIYFIFYFIFFL